MADKWKQKYDDLLINFKDLDRYNDVLYRCFHQAKRLWTDHSGPEDLEQLKKCIEEVKKFEDDLYKTRKKINK